MNSQAKAQKDALSKKQNSSGASTASEMDKKVSPKKEKAEKMFDRAKTPLAIIFAILSILLALAVLLSSGGTGVTMVALMSRQPSREHLLGVQFVLALVSIALVVLALLVYFRNWKKKAGVAVTISFSIVASIQLIVAGILALTAAGAAATITQEITTSFFKATGPEHDNQSVEVWDILQHSLECCGIHSPEEYTGDQNETPRVPYSCCPTYNYTVAEDSALLTACRFGQSYYPRGCRFPLIDFFNSSINLVIALSVIQTIVTICLFVVVVVAARLKRKHNKKQKAAHGSEEGAAQP